MNDEERVKERKRRRKISDLSYIIMALSLLEEKLREPCYVPEGNTAVRAEVGNLLARKRAKKQKLMKTEEGQ